MNSDDIEFLADDLQDFFGVIADLKPCARVPMVIERFKKLRNLCSKYGIICEHRKYDKAF